MFVYIGLHAADYCSQSVVRTIDVFCFKLAHKSTQVKAITTTHLGGIPYFHIAALFMAITKLRLGGFPLSISTLFNFTRLIWEGAIEIMPEISSLVKVPSVVRATGSAVLETDLVGSCYIRLLSAFAKNPGSPLGCSCF